MSFLAPWKGGIPLSQLPPSVVTTSSPADTPPATQGGSQLVNAPPWKANTLYPAGFTISFNGELWTATSTFISGASFTADGANWIPVSGPNEAIGIKPSNTACPAGVNTPLVVLPCPTLIPGSGASRVPNASALAIRLSCSLQVAAGTTGLTLSINATTNAAGTTGLANLAFWPVTITVGAIQLFSAFWYWMPRSPTHAGDVDLGNGAGWWLALHAQPTGAQNNVSSNVLGARRISQAALPTVGQTW